MLGKFTGVGGEEEKMKNQSNVIVRFKVGTLSGPAEKMFILKLYCVFLSSCRLSFVQEWRTTQTAVHDREFPAIVTRSATGGSPMSLSIYSIASIS